MGEGARTALKARIKSKKKASADKKKRRKYRALAGEKGTGEDGGEGEEHGQDHAAETETERTIDLETQGISPGKTG